MSKAVQETITARFIEAIERDNILPWQKGFTSLSYCNATTKRAYRGINILMLAILGQDTEYLTFKQAQASGGCIRKGSKGIPIVFWSKIDKDKTGTNPDEFWFMRYYSVFNLSDCDGGNIKRRALPLAKFTPIELAEKLIAASLDNSPIIYGGNQPSYSPSLNRISMPVRESWESENRFYKTLFHEITHSLAKQTGKELDTNFGSEEYSREELVAELGANFFLSFCGIDCANCFGNSAAYLKNWLGRLKDDSKLLISAASQAQKRFDWLLAKAGLTPALDQDESAE